MGAFSKQQLRQQYLQKRQQLSVDECVELSKDLLHQFQKLNLTGIYCIHLFLPMKHNNEPDTYLIRDWLKTNHPDIRVVFPKTDFTMFTMHSFADDANLQLAENKYGITEPIGGDEVAATEIDMVLLPMLIFDKQGYRVGYGKGFYDRFCAQCKPGTRFVGLSLFEPVDRIDDVNEYDVRMHSCLTPNERLDWH